MNHESVEMIWLQHSRWRRSSLCLAFALGFAAMLLGACTGLTAESTVTPVAPATSTLPSLGITPSHAPPLAISAEPVASFFVEPDDGAAPVLNLISGAKRSIDLTAYLLTDKSVIAALEKEEHAGVAVRVLLERHPYGTPNANVAVFSNLQKQGIGVKWTDPAYALTHEKAMIIDQERVAIMTGNWTLSATKYNREIGVVDTTPADVAEVEAVFQADWQQRTVQPDQPDLVWSPTNARDRLLSLIGSARQTLDIYAEEVDDAGIEQALIDAARRGVRVRLLTSGSAGNDPSQRGRDLISAGGAEVRMMDSPYIHAKMFLVDGKLVFAGSENISAESLDKNRELGIISNDPRLIGRLAATFAHDWAGAR